MLGADAGDIGYGDAGGWGQGRLMQNEVTSFRRAIAVNIMCAADEPEEEEEEEEEDDGDRDLSVSTRAHTLSARTVPTSTSQSVSAGVPSAVAGGSSSRKVGQRVRRWRVLHGAGGPRACTAGGKRERLCRRLHHQA